MVTINLIQPIIEIIKQHTDIKPKLGIILGSGLGPLADEISNAVSIPYQDLPGMPITSVPGHAGELILGTIHDIPVACLKGRIHYYEGFSDKRFKILIRLLKVLGCSSILLTNSSGSLRKEIGPGELVLINDHINFQFRNPLIGPNDEEFGPRFFPMDKVYDKELRNKFYLTAENLGFKIHEGVYISVLGPSFDTPAEIRAFRLLGADVIGMSTIPEVIVAIHCGLRVCLISTITNLSADLNEESITHDITLTQGRLASGKLCLLVKTCLEKYGEVF